jgi:hypothetical protein
VFVITTKPHFLPFFGIPAIAASTLDNDCLVNVPLMVRFIKTFNTLNRVIFRHALPTFEGNIPHHEDLRTDLLLPHLFFVPEGVVEQD